MAKASTGAGSRAVAARVVDDVINNGRNLDSALQAFISASLQDRDQSLVRALAYGTLRTHLRNVALIRQLLTRPLKKKDRIAEALISVGLFALLESQRPDYAVVSATVSAADEVGCRHLRGLINAVLRRFLRERDDLLQTIAGTPAETLHPDWLVESLQADWPGHYAEILAAGNRQAPMWIRVNQAHQTPGNWLERAHAAGIEASAPVAQLPGAVVLVTPQPVTQLPGFAAGDCSVQDVAAQLSANFLRPQAGMRVLDACAAPGGKTGHLLEVGADIELVAVDVAAERLERVEENLERLGCQAQVICGDALEPDSWWDGQPFDRILLDVPCSATGVIRRHPDIRYLRRARDIAVLAEKQLTMLHKMFALLKPGGQLLYSTCSVLKAENQAVIRAFLQQCPTVQEHKLTDLLPLKVSVQTEHGLQLLPGEFDNDGFYYALLERTP